MHSQMTNNLDGSNMSSILPNFINNDSQNTIIVNQQGQPMVCIILFLYK